LIGEYRDPISLAIGLKAHLPTGKVEAYASDGKVRIEPRILAAGDIGPFVYAARVSFIYRELHGKVIGNPFGSELGFGASAGLRVFDEVLVIGPELYGATVVQKSNAAFHKMTTPVELLFSGKFRIADTFIGGLGVGPGITRGYGEPALRLLASFEWFPNEEKPAPAEAPKDRDGDGIADIRDACPDEAGVASDDPSTNGCPAPQDRDGDGILDNQDACPDEAGIKSDDPKKNGCPAPKDRDGDGIADAEDACPDEAGIKSDDPKKNGCPAPKDRDGDGIADAEDACPDQAGEKNVDPKKNGCPLVVVTKEQIVVNERIEFDTGKATLRPESDSILSSVLKVIQEHPEITKLSVQGHTDNRGGRGLNKKLSKNRAANVVKWLVGHGVDKTRLISDGFGQDRPIDDNNSESGRQNNRRVEFRIVQQ
jgi:outer membrane protein OmpA-like peptidoglycan-associated protein